MYDSACASMVRCGVAERLEVPVMLDRNGKKVDDISLMYGKPTTYRLIKPEDCVYVDETGCNTNMKMDSIIGGTKYVTPADDECACPVGLTTDLHFTVLCFTSGTGDPIMCAIILKSERDIKYLPPSWKFGIDETIEMIPGDGE